METWAQALRQARVDLGLSRPVVAGRAGVSVQTVKSYELGLRRPSRSLLAAILDALAVERGLRNAIMSGAGFAPDGAELGPRNADYQFSLDEARSLIDGLPWPAHVTSEQMEVMAANGIAQRLWGVDLAHEFLAPAERNLMTFATQTRFADRVRNWDEVASVGIAVLKGHHRGPVAVPESATAYFASVMERIFDGDPRYVRRLLDLWEGVVPRVPKVRWFYPVTWAHPVVGEMRFLVSVASAHEAAGLTFHEWMPLDAESWMRLDAVCGRPFPCAQPGSSAAQ